MNPGSCDFRLRIGLMQRPGEKCESNGKEGYPALKAAQFV